MLSMVGGNNSLTYRLEPWQFVVLGYSVARKCLVPEICSIHLQPSSLIASESMPAGTRKLRARPAA